ncbi:MAG: transposase, partial [Gammaproteobacteria bacterium]|nr:transposase [Gammaproteobacteria bacterium]
RPDLARLGVVLDQLPDGGIVSALEAKRGRGRSEYPVRAMWRALVSGVVFGHASSASLLRELGRNPALLDACGFDPLGRQPPPARSLSRRADGSAVAVEEASPRRDGIPTAWAFSRFLSNVVALEKESGAVSGMVDALRRRLMDELPGFGRHLGCDGKAVPSHSTGRGDRKTGETSDRDADWGRHETSGVDARTGKAWTKVKTWFGYRLHLIADVEHELPVWFE